MEVILQLFNTADEMVIYSAGMEDALVPLCGNPEDTAHAFAKSRLVSGFILAPRIGVH